MVEWGRLMFSLGSFLPQGVAAPFRRDNYWLLRSHWFGQVTIIVCFGHPRAWRIHFWGGHGAQNGKNNVQRWPDHIQCLSGVLNTYNIRNERNPSRANQIYIFVCRSSAQTN